MFLNNLSLLVMSVEKQMPLVLTIANDSIFNLIVVFKYMK